MVVALHDLALAARFCDQLVLLCEGELVAHGTPQEVLSVERLRSVYEIDAEIGRDGLGQLVVTYHGVPRLQETNFSGRIRPIGGG